MTLGEVLGYDVGLFHYLWVKAMKEIKLQKDSNDKNNKLADVLSDFM